MKTKKRFLGILLALVLMLGLMPGMSMTVYANSPYGLYVGGEAVRDDKLSGTGWVYTTGTNTLTLNGANINAGYAYVLGGENHSAGIYYNNNDTPEKPLNIILNGTNTISGNNLTDGIYGMGYYGSFTFSGDGTLNTTVTSTGIGAYYGNVTIDSGTIHATGTATNSGGIYTNGNVTINGGTVEATGANYGIQAKFGINITGGTVTASATSAPADTSAALYEGGGGTSISITGGTVTATATNDNGKAVGIMKGSSGTIQLGSGITSLTVMGITQAAHGTVQNDLAGMGWTTVDGSGDGTEIAINTSGASLENYKKLQFPYTKPAANVTTPPTAKSDLTYNGSAQGLVTAGEAKNGTMQYAIGTDDKTAPTDGWSTSIPAKTDAGTYYVWYKAKGNEGYSDSDAKCVTAKIAEAPTPTPSPTPTPTPSGSGAVDGRGGSVTTEELKKEYGYAAVNQGSSAAKAGITSTTDAIDALQNEDRKVVLLGSAVECGGADVVVDNAGETRSELVTSKAAALAAVLTPREMVEAVIGNKKVNVILEVQQTQAPDDQAKSDIESKKDANEQVVYINVNLFVEKDGKRELVTEAKNNLKMTFVIPESIRGEGRTFRLIWSHKNADGTLDTRFLDDEDSDPNTFTVSVNKLSTVGLTYTTGSVTPTYTPSYTSGSTTSYSSSSSGSGSGGGSSSEALTGGKDASKAYFAKLSKNTVEYLMPKIKKNAKKAVVPAKVKIGKKTYKVTSISSYAFIGNDSLRSVKIGKNVKRLSPYAFAGCKKLTTIKVRSKKLTAKKIKNSLKDSSVDTVLVLKKARAKFRYYRKIFTQKITGAPKKLSVKRSRNPK